MSESPHVSVVMPAYNGAEYLADAIESVLGQTYQDWSIFILNNASTDQTGEIAERFAAQDSRVNVVHNEELLPVIENWNAAMRLADQKSSYIKVLHADDLLMPECLGKMVAVAERNPSVGIVSAWRVIGEDVNSEEAVDRHDPGDQRELVSGREIGARALKRELGVFGSPTTTLLRADLVRERDDFYDAGYLHADNAVGLQIVKDWDLGFVYEPLTFTREHQESITSTTMWRLLTHNFEHLKMLAEFGPSFFEKGELDRLFDEYYKDYMGMLFRFRFTKLGRERRRWHLSQMREAELPKPPRGRLYYAWCGLMDFGQRCVA